MMPRRLLHRSIQLGLGIAAVTMIAGCGTLAHRLLTVPPDQYVPNPLELPAVSDRFVWSQVVDTVDDYFRIAREQPVVHRDGAIIEGRLETAYRIGGGLLEPWRKDSTNGFQRLQSTLQSIRRRAIVTVQPTDEGYRVEVVVQKELEDTNRTQYATESAVVSRHDGSRVSRTDDFDVAPQTLGWIPLGRDTALEQVILEDVFGRVSKPDTKH